MNLDSNTRNVGVSTISMAGPINLHYSAAGEPSSYVPAPYTNSHPAYTPVRILAIPFAFSKLIQTFPSLTQFLARVGRAWRDVGSRDRSHDVDDAKRWFNFGHFFFDQDWPTSTFTADKHSSLRSSLPSSWHPSGCGHFPSGRSIVHLHGRQPEQQGSNRVARPSQFSPLPPSQSTSSSPSSTGDRVGHRGRIKHCFNSTHVQQCVLPRH